MRRVSAVLLAALAVVPSAAGAAQASIVPPRYAQSASGTYHACGLTRTGDVRCWGADEYGQRRAPAGHFTQLSSGGDHACALTRGGSAACWGRNDNGQSSPPPGRFKRISAGVDEDYSGGHTCAIKLDDQLVCWGASTSGQASPKPGRFAQVSAGSVHSCAVRTNGQGICWGNNDAHQREVPPGRYTQISASVWNSCGLRVSGTVVCWGADDNGVRRVPAGRYVQIASGMSHACALTRAGRVVCWGNDDDGQSRAPRGRFTQISAGYRQSCATTPAGRITCWGTRATEGRPIAPTAAAAKRPAKPAPCPRQGVLAHSKGASIWSVGGATVSPYTQASTIYGCITVNGRPVRRRLEHFGEGTVAHVTLVRLQLPYVAYALSWGDEPCSKIDGGPSCSGNVIRVFDLRTGRQRAAIASTAVELALTTNGWPAWVPAAGAPLLALDSGGRRQLTTSGIVGGSLHAVGTRVIWSTASASATLG